MQIEKKKSSRPQWFSAIRFVLVCVGPSGWKKAFKCENLIMQFQAQLVIQKIRRQVVIKQSRSDIAQLLQNDNIDSAFARLSSCI
ncbi:uncharacterized protein LOC109792078 isoform X2 [Cajanus cajan]|uniref:uncharacterized protein LOC109792078 isoform X2 n=1 Tax=Cajanus cajan TaxID=3821 RepID=UPI0010FBBA90|nr:uncharacterized protein LOC109792078 isoform X2 [Cajanus cajan]